MRKYICFLLIALFCFSLVACSKDEGNVTSSAVTYYDGVSESAIKKEDVAAKVQSGTLTFNYDTIDEIPTSATATLGMSSQELATALPNGDLIKTTTERYVQYSCGGADFFYTNDEVNNGLVALSCNGTAYGFEPSLTTKDDIISVLGEPAVSGDASEEARNLLLRKSPGFTYIDYTFGDKHISFFFYENVLSITVIYKDGLWIY